MNNLERKVDLLARIILANEESNRCIMIEELRAMLSDNEPATTVKNITWEIEKLLTEIGVPCHIQGYYALVKAIHLVVENPDICHAITKELYPQIAKEMGKNRTPARVERVMRHAVETAWSRGDLEVLNKYFGNTVSQIAGKPTNAEFICRMAREIQYRME